MVGSSNRSGLQIFNLSTRVRSSYLAQSEKSTTIRMSLSGVRVSHESQKGFLDIVFNGSMQSLGVCGVSSSLAIQTKGFSHTHQHEKSLSYTKFRMATSLFSTFFNTFKVLALSASSFFPSRVMASFISLQSSTDKGISVME